MKEINFNRTSSNANVEITIHIRDKNGNPTGQTKTYGSDSGGDVSEWYNNQKPSKKKKKRKRKSRGKKGSAK